MISMRHFKFLGRSNTGNDNSVRALCRQRAARTVFFAFLALQLVFLSGCSLSSNVTRWSWTEEVELSSGKIILVDRWEERYKLGGIVQRGSQVFHRAGLRFDSANGPLPKIAWESRVVSPLAIDLGPNGDVYLVTRAFAGAGHVYPRLPGEPPSKHPTIHIAFRLVDGEWKQILLTQLPPKLQRNLLISTSSWTTGEEPIDRPVVTIARKARLDARLDPRGRQIMGDFTYTPAN